LTASHLGSRLGVEPVESEETLVPDNRLRNACIASALLALAFGLRIYGITWGLPEGFEEATPLRKAFEMWGWGLGRGVDFNPHFFKYPSLMIYLQLAAQGLLYEAMRMSGAVGSAIDFNVHYVLDKTPFFVMGRVLNVIIGTATVGLVFVIGRRAGGYAAAVPAAFWLAVNTEHVSRSQMIEVDVPLTFLVLLTFWLLLRAMENPTTANFLYAGLSMGLAMSTKYTGALLGFPVLAAGFLSAKARTGKHPPNRAVLVAVALGAALAAFVLTSPFVLLDFHTFWTHFSAEREHMRLGHFGAGETPTWLYYLQLIMAWQPGWPIALFALAGLVYFGGIRRSPWALAVLAFLLPYLMGISTWEMRADRYLMPALPLFCLLAGACLEALMRLARLSRMPAAAKVTVAGAVAVALAIPSLRALPDHLRGARTDTRTLAAQWIEGHAPAGSFIVKEQLGPELNGPVEFMRLDPAVRREPAISENYGRYAVIEIPMFQVVPERAGIYYYLSLYRDADYIITTSSVRSRYLQEPQRFAQQAAFYDSLETTYTKVAEIAARDRTGSTITIFKNQRQTVPFAKRSVLHGVWRVNAGRGNKAFEADFYSRLGFDYEFFAFYKEALSCYLSGLSYPMTSIDLMKSLVLSATRCLMQLGRYGEIPGLLDRAIAAAPTPGAREEFRRIKEATMAHLPRDTGAQR
jgi:hypothetical protein